MATQLFLLTALADTHLATNNPNLLGTGVGWDVRALGTARGAGISASNSVATVAGPTAGVDLTISGSACRWISPPVSADVTIAGTITGNIWASESNMSANVSINIVVEIIRANALGTTNSNTIVEIARTARTTTEVAVTTRAVNNFTVTPTSTVVNRGDRICVRVFGDDGGSANMASTYTFNIGYNGTTAAVDGDSYVSFTENFFFEQAPGALAFTDHTTRTSIGGLAASERYAQSFIAQGTLDEVKTWLDKSGTPTDDLILEIQSDSAGEPSGSAVATVATVGGASLTTTATEYTYSSLAISLTPNTTYWLVYRRTTAIDASNFYRVSCSSAVAPPTVPPFGKYGVYNTGAWVTTGSTTYPTVTLTFSSSTTQLFLTDVTSDVATASVDKEAWTSRGDGVNSFNTSSVTGWTAPVQIAQGGTGVDWFTPQLQAFTLAGMAVANLRMGESNVSANASVRCEVARVDSDGTNATVWASWCIAPTGTDNGELTVGEVARTCNVSGDDLAFTDGQRIRIRLYADDQSVVAMATGFNITTYYDGTSAAASGDTYITLPQALSEFSSPVTAPPRYGFVNHANPGVL